MLTEQQKQIMQNLGYVYEDKPAEYSDRRTAYLLTTPDGKTLEVYANWADLDADYMAGLIPVGTEGGVDVTSTVDYWTGYGGPGYNADAIWQFVPTASADVERRGFFAWILFIFAIIIVGVVATWILGSINSLLHPCKPTEYTAGGKKIVINPDCSRWELDLATGDVKSLGGGTNDWVILIVLAVVAIGGIWLISQSGILKGIGGGGGSRPSSSGGGGSAGHWGFIQNE
jgi:hypothetical protein